MSPRSYISAADRRVTLANVSRVAFCLLGPGRYRVLGTEELSNASPITRLLDRGR
jgi:hypothetical protein